MPRIPGGKPPHKNKMVQPGVQLLLDLAPIETHWFVRTRDEVRLPAATASTVTLPAPTEAGQSYANFIARETATIIEDMRERETQLMCEMADVVRSAQPYPPQQLRRREGPGQGQPFPQTAEPFTEMARPTEQMTQPANEAQALAHDRADRNSYDYSVGYYDAYGEDA